MTTMRAIEGASRGAGRASRMAARAKTAVTSAPKEFTRGVKGGYQSGALIREKGLSAAEAGANHRYTKLMQDAPQTGTYSSPEFKKYQAKAQVKAQVFGQRARFNTAHAYRSRYRYEMRNRVASPSKTALKVGAATGRAGHYVENHPLSTFYGSLGAVTARNIHEERKEKSVSKSAFGVEHDVSKALDKDTAIVAGIVGGTLGVQAGANEAMRRHYNKHGANVSVKDQYLHPYKSQYKMSAALQRKKAVKLQTKADQVSNPKRAARLNNRANRYRYASGINSQMSRHGAVAYVSAHGRQRYDKTQQYTAPEVIGKSAFGIQH